MSTWNKKNFSIYTSDERSALGLIEELGSQTNYNTEEIERLKESDNKKVSHDEMKEIYKIDNSANFTGSWHGISKPSASNEGLAAIVDEIYDHELPLIKEQMSNISLYKSKQLLNMNNYIQLLFYNNDTSVGCVGDSLTYGLDEKSEDKRNSTSDPTDVGISKNTISKYTYPQVLKGCLQEMLGKSIDVKKLAVGGHTLTSALNTWKTNYNLKIAFMMFGTNDGYREENVKQFTLNYFELIKRFLDWGTAVVLMTPPKKNNYSEIQDVHAEAVINIGKMLNIPVIDTREIFQGYPTDTLTTDGVHFKPEFYYLLGVKVANFMLLKRNTYSPFTIETGKHLYVDIQTNNCFIPNNYNQSVNYSDTYSPLNVGNSATQGTSITINNGGKIFFSFYSCKDIVLVPLFKSSTDGILRTEINFRTSQPYSMSKIDTKEKIQPLHNKTFTQGETRLKGKYGSLSLSDNIFITSKGYNSIMVTNAGTGSVVFYGFEVYELNAYLEKESELVLGDDINYADGISNISGVQTKIIRKGNITTIQFAVDTVTSGYKELFTLPTGFRPEILSHFPIHLYDNGFQQIRIEDWTGKVISNSNVDGQITGYISYKTK